MKPFSTWQLLHVTTLLLLISPVIWAQERDLLQGNNLRQQVVAGDWSETPNGLRVAAGKLSRCSLADSTSGDYKLTVEFTRLSGNDAVAVLIPVGSTEAAIELGGWQGESHGLVRVDGLPSKSPQNPTSVRPGTLINNQRHRLKVTVKESLNNAAIQVNLDGKEIINWAGATSRLQPHIAFTLRKNGSFGLAAHESTVIFHSVKLTSGSDAPSKPATPAFEVKTGSSTTVDLTQLNIPNSNIWRTFNGAQLQVTQVDSIPVASAITNAGAADRGAVLAGIDIKSGVIEVDVRGASQPQSSFLGLAFHAVDGRNYEAVYFRPFNFGSSDPVRRSHAIQYIAHPDWPWDRLRQEKPDQYESRVTPEPQANDWCRLKVVFGEKRVQAFVNDSEQPSLDVPRLSDTEAGSVGLWFNGIAEFKNFRVTNLQ